MKLAELQRLFYERASGAAAGPVAWATPPERIQVYADMFVWRQVDALRADFPRLVELLGDGPFYELAEAYLRARPSTHHSLSQLGRGLPAFLAEGSPELAAPASLAALEWARCEVFDEAPATAAAPEALAELTDAGSARLSLVPALRLLSLRHDAASLWLAPAAAQPVDGPQHVLVWRRGFEVFHAAVAADEALALRRALAGEPLAAVCDAFADREDPAAAALAAVGSWFVEELVHAVVAGESP